MAVPTASIGKYLTVLKYRDTNVNFKHFIMVFHSWGVATIRIAATIRDFQ